MRVITPDTDFEWGLHGTLKGGVDYLGEDFSGYQAAALTCGRLGLKKYDCYDGQWPLDLSSDFDGSMLIAFPGAAGDTLMITPALRAARKKWPKAKICFGAHPNHKWILSRNPNVDSFLDYPYLLDDVRKFEHVIYIEGGLLNDFKRHGCDVLANGLELDSRKLDYSATQEDVDFCWNKFPNDKKYKFRVMFQAYGSSHVRSYPDHLTQDLMFRLCDMGCQVFIPGPFGMVTIPTQPEPVINLADFKDMTFEKQAALLKTCDLCIGIDSAYFHLANAMDVPVIGLFAPFPMEIRITPNHSGIQLATVPPKRAKCAPCHFYPRGGDRWPKGGPCEVADYCVALGTIESTRMAQSAYNILTNMAKRGKIIRPIKKIVDASNGTGVESRLVMNEPENPTPNETAQPSEIPSEPVAASNEAPAEETVPVEGSESPEAAPEQAQSE